VGTSPVAGGADAYAPGGCGEDGGVGGAAFQGPRVPVAAAAVRATAAVGAVEGRCGAGVNSDRAFGGAKSGVQYVTS
jgi:hypothetical protein